MSHLLLQFLHLQQDYEYNLELLDGRDAELERYDKDFDTMRQELAAKDTQISQLHAHLAKAESGLLHLHYHASDPRTSHITKLLLVRRYALGKQICLLCFCKHNMAARVISLRTTSLT